MKPIKTSAHNEPRQLFLNTLAEFYEKLGNKDFWFKGKPDIALEALMQDYLRTKHKGFKEQDANALKLAINEYNTRARYINRPEREDADD